MREDSADTAHRSSPELVAGVVALLGLALLVGVWIGSAQSRGELTLVSKETIHCGDEYLWRPASASGGTVTVPDALPQGMVWENGTRELRWRPEPMQAGPHELRIREQAGRQLIVHQLSLSVRHHNRPPVFVRLPDTQMPRQGPYSGNLLAEDPDGGELEYRLVSGPRGMALESKGKGAQLTWLPPEDEYGDFTVTLQVADASSYVRHSFTLKVVEPPWPGGYRIAVENDGLPVSDYVLRVAVPRHPQMRGDMGDLRFSGVHGERCPYWLESVSAEAGVAWVRLPSVPEGKSEFGVQFGRPNAEPVSDGHATFLLFDDFSDGFDETRWERNRDASGGGCGVCVQDGILHVRAGDGNGAGWLKSRLPLPTGLCTLGRWKLHRTNSYARGGLCYLPYAGAMPEDNWIPVVEKGCLAGVEFNHYTYAATPTPNRKAFYPVPAKPGVSLSGYWQDVWFTQSLGFDGDDEIDNLVYTRDNGEKRETVVHTVPPFPNSPDRKARIFIRPWAWFAGPNHHFAIDWIAVRPFMRNEPRTRVLTD